MDSGPSCVRTFCDKVSDCRQSSATKISYTRMTVPRLARAGDYEANLKDASGYGYLITECVWIYLL